VDMFRKCVDTFTELGGRFYAAYGLAEMGRSLFALGNDTEAEHVWHESLRISAEIHGIPVALYALVGMAGLLAKNGKVEHALGITMIVSNPPASSHDTKNRATRLRGELEAQLTKQQVEAALARTQMQTFETVINAVLKQTELT